MAGQDDSAEKSQEPSQRKLDDARKKGEIAKTPDLLTAMAYLGMLICGLSLGQSALRGFAEGLLPLIEQPDRLASFFFSGSARPAAMQVVRQSLLPAAPFLIVPGVLVLLTLFASRGLTFAGSKLTPKISRISPIENAKNKFGMKGLFEFFKSFAKLMIYSICLALFLNHQMPLIVGALQSNPYAAVQLMTALIIKFLIIVLIVAIAIGALDAFFQHFEHRRRNRMSQKEQRDEHKEAEGDPHLKQQRRGRAQEIAMNQMLHDVPKADVVIVNPTHYAVALKWDRSKGGAPICVAKGIDEIAAKIREIAIEAAVPIHSDPPTARALYASMNIGDEVAHNSYKSVAAAIRFAEAMRTKAKARGF